VARIAGAAVLVAIGLLPGCGNGSTGGGAVVDDQSKTISKSSFPDWPLTVDSGVLKCVGSGGVGKVTIEVDGKTYGINGLASGDKVNLDIRPVWADAATVGVKKDLSPFIQEGFRLCK
jgi:hypothetical protein